MKIKLGTVNKLLRRMQCGLSRLSKAGVLLHIRIQVKMAKLSTDSLTVRALYSSHAQPLFSA